MAPSMLTVLATAALIPSIMAAPSISQFPKRGGTTTSITQVKNNAFSKNATLSQYKAYKKYGATMPEDLDLAATKVLTKTDAAAAAAESGEVTATPVSSDVEYLCPVTIGGQTLTLDFDTGSSDLWVFSTYLPASEQLGHSVFSPNSSSTWRELSGYNWSISYGDGSGASGLVGTDTVEVGGVTLTSQAVEAATSVSFEFLLDTDSDGLLGLAYESLNTVSPKAQTPFFFNVMDDLASPVFTADLKHEEPGTYDFGYIDGSKYTGNITYADVNLSAGYWMIESSGYKVGNGSFVEVGAFSVIDTGTTLLYMDDEVVQAYYAQVPSATYTSDQGAYIFNCTATLPDLYFGVGSYEAIINAEYLNYQALGDGTCYGALQSDDGFGFQLMGDILFKSQFVVFNGETNQVGFAAKSS